MTTCNEFLEAAMLREAREIDPATRQRLEAHLNGCPSCASRAGQVQRALDQVREEEVPDPGAAYWAAFDDRLRARIRRTRAVGRWRTITSLAAALATAAGLWLFVERHRPPAAPRGPERSASETSNAAAEAAEARLETAMRRLVLEEQGARSFESVLDEVLPADPLAWEEEVEKPGLEPPGTKESC